jgi:hypothetical protein
MLLARLSGCRSSGPSGTIRGYKRRSTCNVEWRPERERCDTTLPQSPRGSKPHI